MLRRPRSQLRRHAAARLPDRRRPQSDLDRATPWRRPFGGLAARKHRQRRSRPTRRSRRVAHAELGQDVLDVRAGGFGRDEARRRSRRSSGPRRSAGRPRTRGRSTAATARPRGPARGPLVPARRRAPGAVAAQAVGRRPDLGQHRGRVGMAVHRRQARGEVEAGPGRLPRRPRSSQPGPRARAPRAPPSATRPRGGRGRRRGSAPARRPIPSRRGARAPGRASARRHRAGGAARQAPRPGHDERDEQRPLAGRSGDRPGPPRSARSRRLASPASRSVSARPQSGVRMNWTSPIARPGVERLLEPAARLVQVGRDRGATRPMTSERADHAAAAAAIDELLAGALVGRVPAPAAPVERTRRSSPSSGGSATARSRLRTAVLPRSRARRPARSMIRAARIARLR